MPIKGPRIWPNLANLKLMAVSVYGWEGYKQDYESRVSSTWKNVSVANEYPHWGVVWTTSVGTIGDSYNI